MASTALLGFLKGASGAALDSITAREKEAAERRKLELAAAIDHEYFTKRELFKEGLPSNVQARKERQRKMEREEELHPLQVEAGRLGLDSTRQEMELARNRDARADRLTDAQVDSYQASAARSRTGLDGSSTGSNPISIANNITKSLEDRGLPPTYVADARAQLLRLVREGADAETLNRFEEEFLTNPNVRQELFQNQNAQTLEQIRKARQY